MGTQPSTETFVSYLESLESKDPSLKITQSVGLRSTSIFLGHVSSKNCSDVTQIDSECLMQDATMHNQIGLNYISTKEKENKKEKDNKRFRSNSRGYGQKSEGDNRKGNRFDSRSRRNQFNRGKEGRNDLSNYRSESR